MSGEKILLTRAASSVGIGAATILPIAAPIFILAAWGLRKWLSARQERAGRQVQRAQTLKTNLKDTEIEANKRLQQQQEGFRTAVLATESRQQQTLQQESQRLKRALQAQLTQQREEYLGIAKEQRQEYIQLLAGQEHKFKTLMTAEQQERERGQQHLQQQMVKLQNDTQKQAQFARDLLADVESIWAGIDSDYQHQRFTPGRLADLRRELESARSNVQSGLYQASVATSQSTYLALSDLRLELERREQEWLLLYDGALKNLSLLNSEAKAHQQSTVVFGEGDESEQIHVDSDYWSNGSLSNYQRNLQQLSEQLKAGESSLNVSDLKAINEQIVVMEPRLKEILEQARQSILGSQMRYEIADRVVEVLKSAGYIIESPERDSIYEEGDRRLAYMLKVKNAVGDEIVTVISPQKEFGVNAISINTFSQTLVDEKATLENAKAVFDALDQEGIQGIGQIQCHSEAQAEYRDLSIVSKHIQREEAS